MITRPLYEHGRLSAPAAGPHGERVGRADYDLVTRLREVRAEGDESMTAAEQYDPDFSVKLSACNDEADAIRLLDAWLAHRVEILERTRKQLQRVWQEAQEASKNGPPHRPDPASAEKDEGVACASR